MRKFLAPVLFVFTAVAGILGVLLVWGFGAGFLDWGVRG